MRKLTTPNDESIACKWAKIREYDAQVADGERVQENQEVTETLTVRTKLQQLKKTSSRRLANIKSQFSGLYRKSESGRDKSVEQGQQSEVSNSPNGAIEDDRGGCTSLGSMGVMGARIRSSKSLQNLEQATRDSLRQVVDKTQNMGSNIKHRYGGSRLDMTAQSTGGRYDKLTDDPDSDAENVHTGGL